VAIGLAATVIVGVFTFWLHHKLPYRRMLVLTGVLVALVLVVMIGGTALSFQDLGWLPRHQTPFTLPGWMGAWFEMYSTWETLGVQLLAGLFVIGSYFLAEHFKVRRPAREARRAEAAAAQAVAAPPKLGSA
jgi:high-affinity iron transporter